MASLQYPSRRASLTQPLTAQLGPCAIPHRRSAISESDTVSRWIRDARYEADRLNGINGETASITVEPGLYGVRITGTHAQLKHRAFVYYTHVRNEGGSPFQTRVKWIAESLGMKGTS